MFKKICVFLIFFSLISTGFIYGQTKGEICGNVKAIETGEPLICVNITVDGTSFGAATDTKGYFSIKNIPVGTYEVTASILGYQKEKIAGVVVTTGTKTEINFQLKSEPIEMDNVTVTATRGNNLVTDVPVSTSIITSAELEQQVSQNVGEALESTGGVFIKNYGDLAGMKTISIRGSTDNQVLVLIDGQRLNNSQNSSIDFSTIPIDAVEKIEVVKGGHSALYGANAVGGVVNISTKSSKHEQKFSSDIKSSFGSNGIQIYSIDGTQQIGKIGYYLNLKHLKSDGNYKYENAQGKELKMENNDIKSNNLFFKVNYSFQHNSNLTFSTQYNKIKKGMFGTITYPSLNRRMDETISLYNLSFDRNIFSRLYLRTNAYYNKTDDKINDPDAWDESLKYSRHKNKAFGWELQNRFILSKNIVLTYGYDYRKDELESTQLDKQKRSTNSLYLQGELESRTNIIPLINKVILIPAVRYDDYSDVGSETSPKLGIVFSKTGGDVVTSLRGNVGKSFRSPTFNDLYWPEDYWSVGNPNLKPEIGFNYDAGSIVSYNKGDFATNFEFTYFVSNLEDLIIWVPITAVQWSPQNVDKSETKGVETKLDFNLFNKSVNLNLAYTYMEAKNASKDSPDNGKYLIYRPKHKFDLGIGFQYNFFRLNFNHRYVDKSFTKSDNSIYLPAYRVYDISASVTPSVFNLKLLAKFDLLNIFDRRFIIVEDHPMPGRQVRFTIGLKY